MPKPIDSENVIAWLNAQIEKVQGGWLHDYGFPTNVIAALTDVKCFVKNLPTIAPEVRHGRWMFIEQKSDYLWKCSNCKGNFDQRFSYCPHCGADMEG